MRSAEEYREMAELEQGNADLALMDALKDYYSRLASMLREAAEMREALEVLVSALDECEPQIAAAFQIRQIHTNTYYTGPTYSEELQRARAILGGESHV